MKHSNYIYIFFYVCIRLYAMEEYHKEYTPKLDPVDSADYTKLFHAWQNVSTFINKNIVANYNINHITYIEDILIKYMAQRIHQTFITDTDMLTEHQKNIWLSCNASLPYTKQLAFLQERSGFLHLKATLINYKLLPALEIDNLIYFSDKTHVDTLKTQYINSAILHTKQISPNTVGTIFSDGSIKYNSIITIDNFLLLLLQHIPYKIVRLYFGKFKLCNNFFNAWHEKMILINNQILITPRPDCIARLDCQLLKIALTNQLLAKTNNTHLLFGSYKTKWENYSKKFKILELTQPFTVLGSAEILQQMSHLLLLAFSSHITFDSNTKQAQIINQYRNITKATSAIQISSCSNCHATENGLIFCTTMTIEKALKNIKQILTKKLASDLKII